MPAQRVGTAEPGPGATALTVSEWLLRHAPARLVATYPFANSVVAVLLGWLLLGEAVTVRTAVATAVIVAAVALILSTTRSGR